MTIKFEEMDLCVQESMVKVIEQQFTNYQIDATGKEATGQIVNTIFQAYQKLYEVQHPTTDDGE